MLLLNNTGFLWNAKKKRWWSRPNPCSGAWISGNDQSTGWGDCIRDTGLMKSSDNNFSQKYDHHNQYQASNCVNRNTICSWVCVIVQIQTIGVIIQSIKHMWFPLCMIGHWSGHGCEFQWSWIDPQNSSSTHTEYQPQFILCAKIISWADYKPRTCQEPRLFPRTFKKETKKGN